MSLNTSHARRRPGQSRTAFTLVELLTVIAIIGVLAAILIPVVGNMRHRAKLADSTARLRSLGAAANLYTVEHQGSWPKSTHAYSREEPQWWLALSPYLWSQPITRASDPNLPNYLETILRDPLDPVEQADGGHDNRFSYGINVYLQLGELDDYEGKPTRWHKTYNVPDPTNTVLFATNRLETSDHFMAHFWASAEDAAHDLDPRDEDRIGFVFCDGHTAWLAPEETFDPSQKINRWNPSIPHPR